MSNRGPLVAVAVVVAVAVDVAPAPITVPLAVTPVLSLFLFSFSWLFSSHRKVNRIMKQASTFTLLTDANTVSHFVSKLVLSLSLSLK